MRFRITCKNPKTGQTHVFDLDAHDRGEAEQLILGAGLELDRIEPAGAKADGAPRTIPRAVLAEQEAREERRRVGIAARIIGGGGIVAIVLALLGTILSSGGETFEFHEIKASVRFDGTRFTIVNREDFAWQNLLIDVNGGLANRGYTLRRDVLVADQALAAAAADFVDDRGRHYDPAREPLRQLRIICDIGEGQKALHTRRWGGERVESGK